MATTYTAPWERTLFSLAQEAMQPAVPHPEAPGGDDLLLARAYAGCVSVIAEHGKTFYLASKLLPPAKRRGYDIEIMINEVICEARLPTTVRIMPGVTHRTKRDKFGRRKGYRETWRMFWHLVGLPFRGVVRFRTYWFYWRELTIER